METFENIGKQKTVVLLLTYEESTILQDALDFYCEKHKRKKKAHTLLKAARDFWPYTT